MKKRIIAVTLCAIAAFGLFASLAKAVETAPKAGAVTMCVLPPDEVSD